MKVSVIIPVYNAEKYITSCIESLIGQTLHECEFIFINDGSRDDSQLIIERFKEMDDRVKLISQENQGVSAARNRGLEVAIGEYIGFVDADDYIEKDMFQILYSVGKEEDCDIVTSDFESEKEGSKFVTRYPFQSDQTLGKGYINEKIIPYLLQHDNLNSVCNKIYKRNLIQQNQIMFPNNVSLGEDGTFNMFSFSHASSTKYIHYVGYHYREVLGSATRNMIKNDYFARSLEVYRLQIPKVVLENVDPANLQGYKSIKLINSVMAYIHQYFSPSKDMSLFTRLRYVYNMVLNKEVQESLPKYYDIRGAELGRYGKLIIFFIRKRSITGLFFATAYSRFRNS